MVRMQVVLDYSAKQWWVSKKNSLRYNFLDSVKNSVSTCCNINQAQPWVEVVEKAELTVSQKRDIRKLFSRYANVFRDQPGLCNFASMHAYRDIF